MSVFVWGGGELRVGQGNHRNIHLPDNVFYFVLKGIYHRTVVIYVFQGAKREMEDTTIMSMIFGWYSLMTMACFLVGASSGYQEKPAKGQEES